MPVSVIFLRSLQRAFVLCVSANICYRTKVAPAHLPADSG